MTTPPPFASNSRVGIQVRAYPRLVVLSTIVLISAFMFDVVQTGQAGAAITNWSITSNPALSPAGLSDVTCLSATACVAVGDEANSSGLDQTLVESWDGTSWSIVASPNQGTFGSDLEGVSCISTTSCTAVGFYLTDSGGGTWQTLIESWDGTSWSIVPSPNSGTQQQDMLLRVSCTSASNCTAVGVYQTLLTVVAQQTQVESWDGTSWSVVASPDPNRADNLADVSCTSSTDCVAVGVTYNATSFQTLIESWDGTSWSVASSPNPSASDSLAGVTCTSSSSCLAVGNAFISTPSPQLETLVESWDGTSWSVVSSPSHGTDTSELQAISCVSTTFCQAVGMYFNETTKTLQSLILSWDGTSWSLVSSTPNEGIQVLLGGVSCPDTSHCEVVGAFDSSSNVPGSLILSGLDGDLALTGVPSSITVDATTPAGATASFTAPVATDEETPPAVTCDHASGATYPIGMTTVTCSATDSDDVPSTATASFTVTVNGATGQLNNLLTYVGPLPPGHSFGDDVQAALTDVAGNNTSGACAQLASLITLANAQSGKKLTTAQAAHIVAAATQIEQVLGC